MTMGDTTSNEAVATMEKLELLSATALLKQGIDGVQSSSTLQDDEKIKNRILETPSFGQTIHGTSTANSPSSITSAVHVHKPIFSVASSSSVTGLLMHGVSSPAVDTTSAPNHLASPVSADGDEEIHNSSDSATKVVVSSDPKVGTVSGNTLQASVSNHSLHQMVESRSPISSMGYHRQQRLDTSTPPPVPYGYSLHPRYAAPSAFRPPMENSAFIAFGGATLNGVQADHYTSNAIDGGYYSQNQRQLPSPHSHLHSVPTSKENMGGKEGHAGQGLSYEEMARELAFMREQLSEKDMVVSSLQHRVDFLENKINELRQLPTGKISHIPVDDMIRIMQEYGSEVSNQTLPQRKSSIKKASIVRQFRRWNPEFFQYFVHVNGEWVPKLGREGELRRRAEKRRLFKQQPKVTK